MSDFFTNLKGIFISPGHTLGKLMEKKQWVAMLIFLLTAVFIFTLVSAPGLAEKSRISGFLPEQLEDMGNISGFRLIMASLWSVIITLITLAIASFFCYLFYGIAGAEGTYANFFTVVVHASIIGTLIPMIMGFISLASGFSLVRLFNPAWLVPVSPNSLGFIILTQFNLFYIWYLMVIASGIAHFSKLSFRKCLIVAITYFIFMSAIKVAFSFLFLKLMTG
jgi:hypothetical protein